MNVMTSNHLREALQLAAIIAGTTIKADAFKDTKVVLSSRLAEYQTLSGTDLDTPIGDLHRLEQLTGHAALLTLERVQHALQGAAPNPDDKPLLGTRDLSYIRTLLAITFKWAIDPLLVRLSSSWPVSLKGKQTHAIIDLTVEPDDESRLHSLAARLLALTMADFAHKHHDFISPIMIDKHLADLLKPTIAIGWLPQSLMVELSTDYSQIRRSVMKLLQT